MNLLSAAIDYVNTSGKNRNGSYAGYSSSGADLLSDIVLERRKELVFEGNRYWDLARYNADVERKDVNDNYSDLGGYQFQLVTFVALCQHHNQK